jgi:hypothetical protein
MNAEIAMLAESDLIVADHRIPLSSARRLNLNLIERLSGHRHSPYILSAGRTPLSVLWQSYCSIDNQHERKFPDVIPNQPVWNAIRDPHQLF